MSKRFYYDEFCEEIFDEEIQTYPSNQSICGILNKQAERIAELEDRWNKIKVSIFDRCEFYNDLVEDGCATEYSKGKQYLLNEIYDEIQKLDNGEKR